MILGEINVILDFARDTSNYLTDPHKKCRKVLNQWIYNREFADVFDKLHPGKSSYTWSKSIVKLVREGDRNFSHILIIFFYLLLYWMQSSLLSMFTTEERSPTTVQLS